MADGDKLRSGQPTIDWLLSEATINRSFPAGSSEADIARACVRAMSDFAHVPIGQFDLTGVSTAPFSRGVTLYGRAADKLRECGLVYSVQNGRLYICKEPPSSSFMTPGEKLAQRLAHHFGKGPKVEKKATPRRRGRREAPYWDKAHEVIDEWLSDHGYPQTGDSKQAELERVTREWLNANTEEPPAESTIRTHVTKRIVKYKKKIEVAQGGI